MWFIATPEIPMVHSNFLKHEQWNFNRVYKSKTHPNRVEYGTVSGTYCITHGLKVWFFVSELSIRNIIMHWFHVDNKDRKTSIFYDIIIDQELILQLGLIYNFKCNGLQWLYDTLYMNPLGCW